MTIRSRCLVSQDSLHFFPAKITLFGNFNISWECVIKFAFSSKRTSSLILLITALYLTPIASSMSYTEASCFSTLITALCQTSPASSMSYTVASCSLSILITALCLTPLASSMGYTVASCSLSTLITALCLASPASSMGYAVASCFSLLITSLCLASTRHGVALLPTCCSKAPQLSQAPPSLPSRVPLC